ncbi:MAG: hypothetical protein HYX92_15070 [Chloroflexi bacterium]|nr:hypothetical protein [Chloroflexota bacterium]
MRSIVMVAVVLAAVALAIIGGFWSAGGLPKSIPSPTLTPVPTPMLTALAPLVLTPTRPSAVASARTPSPVRPEVEFDVSITEVSGAGLTRTLSARIANVGRADAHRVWLKLEATSGGAAIKLGGQDYLREDIGALKAASSIQRRVTLSVSPLDGLKVAGNGLRFVLTVYSDERTQTFSYEYRP